MKFNEPLLMWMRRPRLIKSAIFSSAFSTLFVLTGMTSWAATNLVTSGMDSITGYPGYPGELRYTINHSSPGDTIMIIFQGAIQLSWQLQALKISKNLTIIGPEADYLTISGSSSNRVFSINDPGVTAIFSDLTIAGGRTQNGINGTSTSSGGPGQPGGGIFNAGTLTLINCMVTGNTTGDGGNGYAMAYQTMPGGPGGPGGGIYNTGALMLSNSVVANNSTGNGGACGPGITYYAPGGDGGPGGGIYNAGTLRVDNCTVNGNYTGNGMDDALRGPGSNGGAGGGIWSTNSLAANGCTFSGNATGYGGHGGLSDMSGAPGGNGGNGGAIFSAENLALTNCSLSGNSTGHGAAGGSGYMGRGGAGGNGGAGAGADCLSNSVSVNCTVVTNMSGHGGSGGGNNGPQGSVGFGGGIMAAGGSVQLLNTIVALNAGNPLDVSGSFLSLGHNLLGATNGSSGFTAPGDLAGSASSPIDPKLASLAANGGPTMTIALLPGSPAIDAGSLTGAPAADQRGIARPQGRSADIGAYEFQYIIPQITGAAFQSAANFWLQSCGWPNQTYTVQTSTNLLNWSDAINVLTDSNGVCEFVDGNLGQCATRFYRLKTAAP